jgi:hypothetical protein
MSKYNEHGFRMELVAPFDEDRRQHQFDRATMIAVVSAGIAPGRYALVRKGRGDIEHEVHLVITRNWVELPRDLGVKSLLRAAPSESAVSLECRDSRWPSVLNVGDMVVIAVLVDWLNQLFGSGVVYDRLVMQGSGEPVAVVGAYCAGKLIAIIAPSDDDIANESKRGRRASTRASMVTQ